MPDTLPPDNHHSKAVSGASPAPAKATTGASSMRTGPARWLLTVLLGILSAAVVFLADSRGFLDVPELHGYDLLVAHQGPAASPPKEIVYVDFEEDTVDKYNA